MIRNQSARRTVLVAISPSQSEYGRGIAQYARQHDWHLVTDMMFTGTFPRGWKGDGILVLVAYQPDLATYLQSTGIPCVAITDTEELVPLPRVEGDNLEIGRMAAEHFLERAYRSFVWAPFINDKINRDRLGGFQTRLGEHGYTCHVLPPAHMRIGRYWHEDWMEHRRCLVSEIQRLPRPTAIFAFNDCVAADIIDSCRDCGVSVPEEVAVLGVGNSSIICDSLPISLSSVEQNIDEIAYRAAEALDQIMNGSGAPPDPVRIPPKGIITRVSTDMRAVANPRVAQALRYIAENYQNPMLSVLDIANAVGLSRRHLERNFRNETDCTIKDHIVKARMQEASRLLNTHPRAKTTDIAALVGAGAGNFFRVFQRHFGRSPKAHRKWATHA